MFIPEPKSMLSIVQTSLHDRDGTLQVSINYPLYQEFIISPYTYYELLLIYNVMILHDTVQCVFFGYGHSLFLFSKII